MSIIPSGLDNVPSSISITGRIAAPSVKNDVDCIVLLSAVISLFGENKTAKPTANVKAIKLLPIMSPKESSGIPCRAEVTPTKRFGNEAATAITKKATTNSFNPKNLDNLTKPLTIKSPEKYKRPQDVTKISIFIKTSIIRF